VLTAEAEEGHNGDVCGGPFRRGQRGGGCGKTLAELAKRPLADGAEQGAAAIEVPVDGTRRSAVSLRASSRRLTASTPSLSTTSKAASTNALERFPWWYRCRLGNV
jgi:hypothetical protein